MAALPQKEVALSRTLFKYRIYVFACLALTVIAAALRTVALFTAFDAQIGYFRAGFFAGFVRGLIVAAVALFCTVPFFIKKEETLPRSENAGVPVLVGAGIATVLFAAVGIVLFFVSAEPTALRVLAALFSLGGTVYFGFVILSPEGRGNVFAGFAVILALVLLVLLTYFDRYTPMNAPHKVALHLCLLASALALLGELRENAGIPAPRARLAFSLIAVFLAGTVGVSDVIAFAARVYTDLTYFFLDLLALGGGVYFALRASRTLCVRAEEK